MVWLARTSETTNDRPLNLWGSAPEVLAVFPGDAAVVIEIGACPDPQSAGYWAGVMEGFAAPPADDAAQYQTELLGYDVADRYLLSGLSNCGFSEAKMQIMRRHFAARINTFGLFCDPEDAAHFRAICDQLVQENAPFCVYRIRSVKPSR